MPQPQFNFTPARADAPEGQSLGALIIWLNKQFQRLASMLKGPQTLDKGNVGLTTTINPNLAHLTTATLTDTTAITLELTDTRSGTVGFLELTQDATGGHTPTWANAHNTPSVSTTASKRTMLLAVRDSDGWVLSTLASGY